MTLGPLSYGDGFLVRLSPDGSRAIYSTYVGGSAADRLYAVAVDASGTAFVAGRTEDSDVIPGGSGDALLAAFDPSGHRLKETRYGTR